MSITSIESTSQLTPDEINPRKISEDQKRKLGISLDTYGDLSGIVFNRRTRKLIGGHQRTNHFGPECEINCKYFDKTDKQGTVGIGYIILKDGSKHGYREVDWPKELAAAANIAANAHGGEWEENALREMLTLASSGTGESEVNPDTIGLEQEFMENLFKCEELTLNIQEQETKALTEPMTISEINNLPSQTSMIQLFFTLQTRPAILENMRKLQVVYGTANLSDTARIAFEFALKNRALYEPIKES